VGLGFAGKVFHAPVIRAVEGLRLTTIVQRHGPPDPRYPDVEFVHTVDEMLTAQDRSRRRRHPEYVTSCRSPSNACSRAVTSWSTSRSPDARGGSGLGRDRKKTEAHRDRVPGSPLTPGISRTVQQVVSEGTLGRVVLFESHFDRFQAGPEAQRLARRNPARIRASGSTSVRTCSIRRSCCSEPPMRSAPTFASKRPDALVERRVSDVTLFYRHARAVLRASMLAAPVGPTWIVNGTKGSFIKYGMDPQEAALKEGRTPDEPDWDSESPELYGKLITPDATRTVPTLRSSFARYYENVRDAMLAPPTSLSHRSGRSTFMRGLQLAIESNRTRRVLPWNP